MKFISCLIILSIISIQIINAQSSALATLFREDNGGCCTTRQKFCSDTAWSVDSVAKCQDHIKCMYGEAFNKLVKEEQDLLLDECYFLSGSNQAIQACDLSYCEAERTNFCQDLEEEKACHAYYTCLGISTGDEISQLCQENMQRSLNTLNTLDICRETINCEPAFYRYCTAPSQERCQTAYICSHRGSNDNTATNNCDDIDYENEDDIADLKKNDPICIQYYTSSVWDDGKEGSERTEPPCKEQFTDFCKLINDYEGDSSQVIEDETWSATCIAAVECGRFFNDEETEMACDPNSESFSYVQLASYCTCESSNLLTIVGISAAGAVGLVGLGALIHFVRGKKKDDSDEKDW